VVIVRAATERDRDAWLELRCALWAERSRAEHCQEIARFFAGAISEPEGVLLAECDSRMVGFAELSIRPYAEGCTSDRVAYLEGWYVVPEFRRRKVGAALIAAAESWSRAQGCTELASDTEADNDLSAAAHARCGFEEMALIRCFRKRLGAG
jgi:aminoglycoside 6'-N-acetyltransferase I